MSKITKTNDVIPTTVTILPYDFPSPRNMSALPLTLTVLTDIAISEHHQPATYFRHAMITGDTVIHVTSEHMQRIADWLASLGVRASSAPPSDL